ncbi:Hpt domain-containing protein [Cellvibrio sp. NN19]|uniref:hybrid sensor histidine kinase/response regulator n=1 Tax=Cellvibrio chitinivorans TaxID=3102792 RepID=UPI002B4142F8|nr:Hpt domain-containing protein [Cellvibrio sp. NN19]
MADNRNFAALDWLIHEISETLKEARQALESYVENPKDATRIRFCLTHIHQVHGSLQMVEFYGAAMLASEMEQLTQAMIAGRVANSSEAQEVLMRAILQFPLYLEQVKATRKDNPLVVLPLLNDLRAVRGESLLTDTKLFVPNLTPAKKVSGARLPVTNDNVQFQAMVLKLRQMYQYAASGFIRNVNPDENLAYLQKAFSRLQKLTHGTARFALWDISLALVEAIEIDAIEISVAVKNLLRQLDTEIKVLAVHGTKALNSFTNDELIKNLLYYVARAGKHAPGFAPNSQLQRIYETYHLEEALLEGKEGGDDSQNMLSVPDADAMRSVVGAIKEELNLIKSSLDVCLAGGDSQSALTDALPIVKRVADTLAVLGLGDLRKRVLEQGAALDLVVESESQLSDDQLLAVASQLIAVENTLDGLIESGAQQETADAHDDMDITLSRAKESVLRESRNGLEHAKDAIIEYIASQWNRQHLHTVPGTLREIRGGLEIMPLPRPARILGACARFIEEQLLQQDATPQWTTLDTLADAITSVEYYLERLSSGGRKEENDLLLTGAEESVASLGYAVAKTSKTSDTPAQHEPETESEIAEQAIELDVADAQPEVAAHEEHSAADELAAAYQDAFAQETPAEDAAVESLSAEQSAIENPVVESYEEAVVDAGDTNSTDNNEDDFAQLTAIYANEVADETAETEVETLDISDTIVDLSEPAPATDIIEADTADEAVAEVIESEAIEAQEIELEAVEEAEAVAENAIEEENPEASHGSDLVATSNAPVIQRDDEDIDDEIIEIFIEEATEVTETIAEYFPRWAQNHEDNEALTEFRRAFHTLKGSGRMVGANEIGELAWSIENMLNRVIDRTITAGAVHVHIIEQVRLLLPDMIAAFRDNQPNPHAALAETYRQQATLLSQGTVPAELLAELGSAPAAPVVAEDETDDGYLAEEDPAETLIDLNDELALNEVAEDSFAAEDEDSQLDVHPLDELSLIVEDQDTSDEELTLELSDLPVVELDEELEDSAELSDSLELDETAELGEIAVDLDESAELDELAALADSDEIPTLEFTEEVASQILDEQIDLGDISLDEHIELSDEDEVAQLARAYSEHQTDSFAYIDEDSEGEDADYQLWEIFGTEALTHLQTVEEYIARMEAEAPIYEPPSEGMQRALHTLKGSAHMAEVTQVAELATPLERFVKELRSYHVNINDDILQLLRDAVIYTQIALHQIEGGETVDIPRLQQFIARVNELREIHVAPLVSLQELDESGKRPVDPELLAIFMAEEMNLLLDADKIIALWAADPADTNQLTPVMDELGKLTKAAAHAYLPAMAELSEKIHSVYELIIANQLACSPAVCTTLNSAHIALLDMVDAIAAGQNLNGIPDAINESLDELLSTEAVTLSALINDQVPAIEDVPVVEEVALEDDLQEETLIEDALIEDVEAEEILLDEALPLVEFDEEPEYQLSDENEPEKAALDFDEALDLSEAIEYSADDASLDEDEIVELIDDGDDIADIELEFAEAILESEVEKGDSDEYDVEASDETPELILEAEPEEIQAFVAEPQIIFEQEPAPSFVAEQAFEADAEDDDFDPEIIEIFIEEANELLEEIDTSLNEWQEDWNNTASVEELKRLLHTFKGGARLAGLTDLGDLSHDFETILIEMDDDAELDQSFFNRLHDYQDRMHSGVARVQARMNSEVVADEPAIPVLNTPIANDYTPHIETPAVDDYVSVDDAVADLQFTDADAVPVLQDELHDEHQDGQYHKPTVVVDNTRDHADNLSEDSGFVPNDFSPNDLLQNDNGSQKPNVLTFAPKAKPTAPVPGAIPGTEYGGGLRSGNTGPAQVQHLAARRSGPQEVVKVSAELLEELVNLAGETSISRGRMEQQVSDLSGSIEEMDSTIQRLQEQLRRLDIETEAQVLFRQEQMAQHEEFDPLEMDRYSQLQQLSRSLIESASDLMDLKFTLADKTRDTETLLLQQSRINTDLQEGLMRSRMVPFSRLVPRLRRIVRQAATELGKEVDFELDNIEGELDRTVLERMVAPLEHMLRNAVDHGIEMPDERIAAGKNANGRILLTLGREGGDVIIRLIDDGRGINLKRVREKAVERGLMAADAQLADQDVIQFILHAGFSTAEKVTQISGRGVGMDVVHSEIKQLGGAMFIDSEWGNGTQFTIRLPFTVSVNRALMVQIGEDLYAIPLNTIEGIVRVSPFELEHYYQDESARFDYAGENYLVRYLGNLLDSSAQPKLDGQMLPLPVILVRSTEHTVALQVDRLLGSREIVVKTLGAQFSAVRGVSGATVMGDGNVVVILDLHAMIREQLALGLQHSILLEPNKGGAAEDDQSEKTVMVVDDSVTVRKVTTRFLEREGFRVISAKDGVEALQVLQDQIPDVMLLDIEMPRMDGFEVAKNIRTSSRLKDLPIIMITSRTGEKHRERAFSLGVNKYMGKPYQEDLLLNNINELLGKKVR